jgi:CRISPR-associated protein Cmr6
MNANAGYLFYHNYYSGYSDDDWNSIAKAGKASEIKLSSDASETINKINNLIGKIKISDDNLCDSNNILGTHHFLLETTYPGLLTGSGYNHETGVDNEYKIGFYFDYTSGIPEIPASSVKGIIRSVFPGKEKDKKEYRKEKIEYIKSILGKSEIDIEELEQNIFDGVEGKRRIPIYKRDIFFSANVGIIDNKNKKLFGSDYITPHLDPLKNPVPLKFLKVLSLVKFKFKFNLFDYKSSGNNAIIVTAEEKLNLFKQILLDIGAGAKTNVGYGQFT